MADQEWPTEMAKWKGGKGERVQGMDSALSTVQWKAETRRQACRCVSARTFLPLLLLWFIVPL